MLYGMRRGEVLDLRWQDVDFQANELRIRQQLRRIQGELHRGLVKTRTGRRDLPLLGLTKDALRIRHTQQSADWARLGDAWADTGLVFTTRTGRPIEPRNLVRSSARSPESAIMPVSGRSASMPCGIRLLPCSKALRTSA
jgi:integrase